MWQWFHKLGSPKWFFGIAGRLIPWLGFGALILLGVGIVWGLLFAPADYQQGDSYRIIFIHVPSAYLGQSLYVAMAVAGAVGLIWRMKMADTFIAATAPVGAALTFVALFTGAVWGKPTWGTWWVWDARLTSMLLLFFLYLGVMALRRALEDPENRARASAILTLVGVVNIPIIKFSVEWWNTLHQPASIKMTEAPAMPASMWVPLLICAIGFHLLAGWLILMRMRNEILYRERRARWVRDWLLSQ
ncbi:heme exporter protein C [Halospina denitrificans]|uniref:Heme exporter protein C n=1 Tax=Halospina denitrificans TaxID=332522 RepID=A0A4R7JMK6_9GAMM|nr:heme ABC transporter permease [Halospina denitrificans]TDT39282.1 heme exporter protein C [Halospina denitrificans]